MRDGQLHNGSVTDMLSPAPMTRRIVVCLDLRVYQQTIVETVGYVRPSLALASIDPGAVTAELLEQIPSLVICRAATETIQAHAESWIVLCPGDSDFAVVGGLLGPRQLQRVELDDLLRMIDEFASSSPAG